MYFLSYEQGHLQGNVGPNIIGRSHCTKVTFLLMEIVNIFLIVCEGYTILLFRCFVMIVLQGEEWKCCSYYWTLFKSSMFH